MKSWALARRAAWLQVLSLGVYQIARATMTTPAVNIRKANQGLNRVTTASCRPIIAMAMTGCTTTWSTTAVTMALSW